MGSIRLSKSAQMPCNEYSLLLYVGFYLRLNRRVLIASRNSRSLSDFRLCPLIWNRSIPDPAAHKLSITTPVVPNPDFLGRTIFAFLWSIVVHNVVSCKFGSFVRSLEYHPKSKFKYRFCQLRFDRRKSQCPAVLPCPMFLELQLQIAQSPVFSCGLCLCRKRLRLQPIPIL